MIKRLLIANRGEIALRIIRACRELGIETSRSTRTPTSVRRTSPRPIAPCTSDRRRRCDSYLSIERLIDAARRSGADAVHPGYGFLSENAAFAAACEEAGIVFVGPPASVIAQMGSKIEARRLMADGRRAGRARRDAEGSVGQRHRRGRRPRRIAGAGQGVGRRRRQGHAPGRRPVGSVAEADPGGAARRRSAAFGDGTLYVERLIERPRHVEVQVFADDHGHVVHLFERECSVQRRHQKVIEESPSPVADAALRARMTEAAVAAARASSYRNAGTIEFLVDGPPAAEPSASISSR